MTDWKKILRESLKENDGAYDKAIEALESAGIKLQDVGQGDYISAGKYKDDVDKLNDEISKLNDKIASLGDTNNSEIAKLNETHASELQAQKDKMHSVVKSLAISASIKNLGINDALQEAGLKALIKQEDIKIDDNFNIVGGLDEQINELKTQYAKSFEAPKVVSTGSSIPTSSTIGSHTGRVYSSLAEISNLTPDEIAADYENITSQLSNLK